VRWTVVVNGGQDVGTLILWRSLLAWGKEAGDLGMQHSHGADDTG